MKDITKASNFCNDFTYHDHYFIEGVIETNHVDHFKIEVSIEIVFIHADMCIRVLGVIDDMSLKVI